MRIIQSIHTYWHQWCFVSVLLYFLTVWWYPDFGQVIITEIKPKTTKRDKNITVLNNTEFPVIIYWTREQGPYQSIKRVIECSHLMCELYAGKFAIPSKTEGAYLFYASGIRWDDVPRPRNPDKVIWAFHHEESPKNSLELMLHLNLFNYSSTFNRHSNVPFPLQNMVSLDYITSTNYFVDTYEKNRAMKKISPILYLQSICVTLIDRDAYVRELMKYQNIDSYGDCLKNKNSPRFSKSKHYDYLNNLQEKNFLRFVANYKFVIAIENGVCDDYLTEKFWRAIHVGVVPIYYGTPTIRDWLPNEKSAILINDFATPKLLSKYLDNLLQDDVLYEEHLEHKTKGLISNQRLIHEIEARPYQTNEVDIEYEFLCFICKKLYEKDKGVNIVSEKHLNCSIPSPILTNKANHLM